MPYWFCLVILILTLGSGYKVNGLTIDPVQLTYQVSSTDVPLTLEVTVKNEGLDWEKIKVTYVEEAETDLTISSSRESSRTYTYTINKLDASVEKDYQFKAKATTEPSTEQITTISVATYKVTAVKNEVRALPGETVTLEVEIENVFGNLDDIVTTSGGTQLEKGPSSSGSKRIDKYEIVTFNSDKAIKYQIEASRSGTSLTNNPTVDIEAVLDEAAVIVSIKLGEKIIESKITITTDEENTFICTASGNPTPTITWKVKNMEVPKVGTEDVTVYQNKGSLIFEASSEIVNPTSYTCEATNTVGVESSTKTGFKTIEVTRNVPPQPITITLNSETVTDSQTIVRNNKNTFTCTSSGNPTPTIRWSLDGDDVSNVDTDPVYQENGDLVFTMSAPLSESTNYTCTASSPGVSEKKQISIIVEGPPVVTINPTQPPNSDSIELTCEVEGNPEPSLEWKWKDSLSLPSTFAENTSDTSKTFTTSSTLTISSALCLGPGDVTCTGSNKHKDAEVATQNINLEPYSSYKQHYLIYKSEVKTFDEAKIICEDTHGGNILCINGQDIQNHVTDYIGTSVTAWTEFYFTKDCASHSCNTLVNSSGTWQSTDACQTGQSKNYVCQITASSYPSQVENKPDRCANTLELSWSIDGAALSSVQESVYVKNTNGSAYEATLTPAEPNSITLDKIPERTNVDIKIFAGDGVCAENFRPYGTTTEVGGYGDPIPPAGASASNGPSDEDCAVKWNPVEYYWELENIIFKYDGINPTKSDNHIETIPLPPNSLSHTFKMQPNTVYDIQLQSKSKCNEELKTTSLNAACSLGSRAPDSLSELKFDDTLQPNPDGKFVLDADDGISISMDPPADSNGDVACISIIGKIDSKTATGVSGSFQNIETITLSDNLNDGDYYLAYTTANTTSKLETKLGSGSTTSCDPKKSNRKRRALPESYSATDHKLQSDKTYQFFVFTTTVDGSTYYYATTDWSPVYLTNPAPNNPTGIIVGVVVTVIVLICFFVALFIFMRTRRNEKDTRSSSTMRSSETNYSSNGMHVNQAFDPEVDTGLPQLPPAIPLERLEEVYTKKHADDDLLFRSEYSDLATHVTKLQINYDYSTRIEVRDKNRFSNIHSANESRVVLRRRGTDIYSDYINASYIHGYRHPNKFIATQGPITNTISDFWYMVYDQESTVIVMLTKLVEYGRKKCEKYWPENNETKTFGNMVVDHISTVVMGDIIKRTFDVSNPNQSAKKQRVEQFHFIAWPDHGVPNTTTSLFNLRRMVTECQGKSGSPIIVHCSAGVGRSGAFIVLDTILLQITQENRIDIFSIVMNMRRRRKEMVQTVEQYSLLHKLAWEAHLFREYKDRTVEEFQKLFGSSAEYQEVILIDKEFNSLKIVPPIRTAKVNTKNIVLPNPEIVPYEHSKVVIRMRPNESTTPFFNASNIKSYDPSNEFIVCQGPLPDNCEQFWRVVLDNEIKTVVMLTELEENNQLKCSQYWPGSVGATCEYGSVGVTLESEKQEDDTTERTINVKEKVSYMERNTTVKQFHYHLWKDSSVPESTNSLLSLVSKVQRQRSNNSASAPVLVHCSDGAGRSGTFCAINTLIDRIKNENRIDVFRTVKDLRDLRPGMVENIEQYRFCYRVVEDFLQSFDLYSNFK